MSFVFGVIGFICLVSAFFGMFQIFPVFINPLRGQWPEFTGYYMKRGVVMNTNTVKETGSTSSVTEGVFGNLNVNTSNFSVDHDVVTIKKADGTLDYIRGTFLGNRAVEGDTIAVGGVDGYRDTHYKNITQDSTYSNTVATNAQLFFSVMFLSIPFLGEFLLFIRLVGLFSKMRQGMVSELPTTNENKNVLFALFYHILSASMGALVLYNDMKAVGSAFEVYWLMTLGFTAVHMLIWRKDAARFLSFLRKQAAQA
jgi:hypothetical protein